MKARSLLLLNLLGSHFVFARPECKPVEQLQTMDIFARKQKDYYAEVSVKDDRFFLRECFAPKSPRRPQNIPADPSGAPLCLGFGRDNGYPIKALQFELAKANKVIEASEKAARGDMKKHFSSLMGDIIRGIPADKAGQNWNPSGWDAEATKLHRDTQIAKNRKKSLEPLLSAILDRENCKSFVIKDASMEDPVLPFKKIIREMNDKPEYFKTGEDGTQSELPVPTYHQ